MQEILKNRTGIIVIQTTGINGIQVRIFGDTGYLDSSLP